MPARRAWLGAGVRPRAGVPEGPDHADAGRDRGRAHEGPLRDLPDGLLTRSI